MVPNIRKRPRLAQPIFDDDSSCASIGHNQPKASTPRLEQVAVSSLALPAREIRKHSKKQVTQIAASMRQFGAVNPIIVDSLDQIVCGVGRFLAAKEMKLSHVPVLRVEHLSREQLRLYAIADNKLGELSNWDDDLLKIELIELQGVGGLELETTGIEGADLEKYLLEADALGSADETEEIEEPENNAAPVSRLGDLFQIGDHFLLCGNARHAESYAKLMRGDKAHMAVCDIPYNVKISRNVSGLGKVKHGEFVEASGEMNRSEFTEFMSDIFGNVAANSVDGSIHFQCIDWRHQVEMMTAGERHYSELKNLLIWVKTNAGMSAFYRSQHELIYAWKSGTAPHINNFKLGQYGRYRTNVLQYPGCNTFRKGRAEDLAAHSTVKPTGLIADLIRDVSNIGDIVIDPTSGSGTTILAAERVKRRARCIELDPKYVDVTIRRAKARLKLDAIHVDTGLTFDNLAQSRLRGSQDGEMAA